MQQFQNPYAAMSAEQLQGLAQQQSLSNIQRQQAFIESRKNDIQSLAGQPMAKGNSVLMPLAGLTDAWTGSNFSRQAQALGADSNQERLAMIQKIENSIANSEGSINKATDNLMDSALREKLNKAQMDMLGKKMQAKEDDPNLKDFEYKAAMMGQRADLADSHYNAAIQKAATEGYDPISRSATFDNSKLGKAAAFVGVNDINPVQKEIDAAERAFLISTLRDESGASIGVQEADNQREIYFPRFGDSPETIANKAQLREAAKAGLQAKAGKAWNKVDAKVKAAAPASAPAASKPLSFEEWQAQKKGKKS